MLDWLSSKSIDLFMFDFFTNRLSCGKSSSKFSPEPPKLDNEIGSSCNKEDGVGKSDGKTVVVSSSCSSSSVINSVELGPPSFLIAFVVVFIDFFVVFDFTFVVVVVIVCSGSLVVVSALEASLRNSADAVEIVNAELSSVKR